MSARTAVLVFLAAIAAAAIATVLYHRSLARALLEDRPLAIETVRPGPVEAARRGAELRLSEEDLNRLLFSNLRARLALAEPYARLGLSQRDAETGRWLNAELLVAIHLAPEGIAMRVLSGRVGKVSVSGADKEWVRGRIERQLAFEIARLPRIRELFFGAREIRVEGRELVARF
jgi:hypothetical protein